MKRDLDRLVNQKFDVVIIGGGIQGASIALESSRRGLKTGLFEKADFCSATSANSLKILHGGFRYLQGLNFKRMRESIHSRNSLMRLAPHLVNTLPCVVPTYGHGLRGRHSMRMALLLNDMISWDRNDGLNGKNRLPRGKLLSLDDYCRLISESCQIGTNGGALWYDVLANDTERITISALKKAVQHGACLANYIKAQELLIDQNKKVCGVLAQDILSGNELQVQAQVVINATGPWLKRFMPKSSNVKENSSWAKGLNIVCRKQLVLEAACGVEGTSTAGNYNSLLKKGKRFFFFVPWRGYTMIGTIYTRYDSDPEELCVSRQEIKDFVHQINELHPHANLRFQDVTFYHAGLLPMTERANDKQDVFLQKNEVIIDHEISSGIAGFFSVKSVKYTTAPIVAAKLLQRIVSKQRLKLGYAYGHKQYSKSCRMCRRNDNLDSHELSPQSNLLKMKYGSEYRNVYDLLRDSSELKEFVNVDPPLLSVEIVHAVRNEMAITLSDVVFRRTGLGTAECPSLKTLNVVARAMGRELGWDEVRMRNEIKKVLNRYSPLVLIDE